MKGIGKKLIKLSPPGIFFLPVIGEFNFWLFLARKKWVNFIAFFTIILNGLLNFAILWARQFHAFLNGCIPDEERVMRSCIQISTSASTQPTERAVS